MLRDEKACGWSSPRLVIDGDNCTCYERRTDMFGISNSAHTRDVHGVCEFDGKLSVAR